MISVQQPVFRFTKGTRTHIHRASTPTTVQPGYGLVTPIAIGRIKQHGDYPSLQILRLVSLKVKLKPRRATLNNCRKWDWF